MPGAETRVVLVLVGAGVLDDEQVDGGDAAVLAQSDLHPAEEVGPCPADVVLLLARDPHHHRQSELLRQQRRNRHRVRAGNLAAEAAAGVLAHDDDLRRIDTDPAGHRRHRLGDALRRAMEEELAVLPVGHRRPRLERLVPGGVGVEGLVEHQRGVAEAGLDVAVLPPCARLSQWEHAVAGGGEHVGGPLHRGHLAVHERVALLAGVGAAGPQAGDRIDDERQRIRRPRVIASMASAAVHSSTAATASTGSPW